jgi:hypothetical protein
MIRKFVAAFLALASAGAAVGQDGVVVDMWSRSGEWITVLSRGYRADWTCSIITAPQSTATAQKVSFGFDFSGQEVDFALNVAGAPKLEPTTLQVQSAGSVLVEMPVVRRSERGLHQIIEAKLPRDAFIGVIAPSLLKGRQLTIRADDKAYVLPSGEFMKALDNLLLCRKEAQVRNARHSG